jgi:hypothetical protein
LLPEYQKIWRRLCSVTWLCTQKYDDTLQKLVKWILDIKEKIFVKILTAQAYYEMVETERLLYSIDSAKHFLSKNKSVSESRKKSYLNFFSVLSKLISIRENGDKSAAASFTDEVKSMAELNEKAWVLEKLDELRQ